MRGGMMRRTHASHGSFASAYDKDHRRRLGHALSSNLERQKVDKSLYRIFTIVTFDTRSAEA